jgi:hypothetical protein
VEVSKLSLLLKLIEGQTQQELEISRMLPDLDQNIQLGNSLVSSDFAAVTGVTPAIAATHNPFDWDKAFPSIMTAGGFDVVIGNPPYLSVDDVWGMRDPRLAYLRRTYAEVYSDKTDILFYFLKKAVDLCRGEIGMIVSRAFLEAAKARNLRGWLGEYVRVREIVDFREATVFKGVGIQTAIVHFTASTRVGSASIRRLRPKSLPVPFTPNLMRDEELFDSLAVPQAEFKAESWIFAESNLQELFDKVDAAGDEIGEILKVGQGMQTGANKVFQGIPLADLKQIDIDPQYYFIRARNSDIQRFRIVDSGIALLYPNDVDDWQMLPEIIKDHLLLNKARLAARAAYRRGNCDWWKYTWPLHREFAHHTKILCPYLASYNRFALDLSGRYLGITDTTVLYDNGQPEDLRYILGVLNSRLLTLRFRYIGKLKGGGVFEYFENTVRRLPIPRRKPGDRSHDEIAHVAQQLIDVNAEYENIRSTADRNDIDSEIRALQTTLDKRVYELFGLSQAEIILVENTLPASDMLGQESEQVDLVSEE